VAPSRGSTRDRRVTSKTVHRASPRHSPLDQTATHMKWGGPALQDHLPRKTCKGTAKAGHKTHASKARERKAQRAPCGQLHTRNGSDEQTHNTRMHSQPIQSRLQPPAGYLEHKNGAPTGSYGSITAAQAQDTQACRSTHAHTTTNLCCTHQVHSYRLYCHAGWASLLTRSTRSSPSQALHRKGWLGGMWSSHPAACDPATLQPVVQPPCSLKARYDLLHVWATPQGCSHLAQAGPTH
jgi:hypothetical protein